MLYFFLWTYVTATNLKLILRLKWKRWKNTPVSTSSLICTSMTSILIIFPVCTETWEVSSLERSWWIPYGSLSSTRRWLGGYCADHILYSFRFISFIQGWKWKIIPRLISRLKRLLPTRIAYSEFSQKTKIRLWTKISHPCLSGQTKILILNDLM